FDEAQRPGLPVEECVQRLKRYHYSLKRLHQVFNNRIPSEPVYELKMTFSLHAYYCSEHVTALRQRVGEMREPPLGLESVPDKHLEILFDEILAAPTTAELLLGVYEAALPSLQNALQQHLTDTNPLADHPSVRIIRFALLEIAEMIALGQATIDELVDKKQRAQSQSWLDLLNQCLSNPEAAGQPAQQTVKRKHSAIPYQYDGVPRRDDRFPDPYNMAVNAESFLYDEQYPPEPKTLIMFYKRLREIDVPEMMSSIIAETPGKPWGYYRDMTRQLWDEARHAMMGEVGFVNLGIDWPKTVMVNFNWSHALNTQLTPIERHAVLYFIEQGLMPRTGKRFEWEVALDSSNPLSALFQDYDWADEVLHARIGRNWYLPEFDNPKAAIDYGDDCWSRVMMDWNQYRKDSKTGHRNWWPDLYSASCKARNIEPDPNVMSFSTSYETVRADLRPISSSG
ncbi:MAG: hypothetical protein QGF29_08925, partial [Verrucomicrobiota bacterium]|nr:hypothetical protein [Verrucomicrobiota bacterium]